MDAHSEPTNEQERPATLGDMATLTFGDAGPEAEQALGSFDQWIERAPTEYTSLRLAAHSLRKNDAELFEMVRELGPEVAEDFMKGLFVLKDRYEGLAQILNAAAVRQ